MTPWEILGLEPTADERRIKRAYARLLKENRPDEDKEGFLRLRQAYEQALQLKDWLPSVSTEADEGNNGPASPLPEAPLSDGATAPPLQEPEPPPRRPEPAARPQPPVPEVRRPETPPPPPQRDLPVPARTRTDYRRGWKSAARLSESALADRIRQDIEDPVLIHLEKRADYEQALLAWLLQQKQPHEAAFRAAVELLHWEARTGHGAAWPWSELERYQRRCRLHAFFRDPAAFAEESPALCLWLAQDALPEPARRPWLRRVLFKRAGLKQELAALRSRYHDVLSHEPEGLARLEILDQALAAFPMEKLTGLLSGILLTVLFLTLSGNIGDGGASGLLAFLLGLGVLAFTVHTGYRLFRDHLWPALLRLLSNLLNPPSWTWTTGLLTCGLALGLPSGLLALRMPHLAPHLRGWLDASACLLLPGLSMLWNRLSDLLAEAGPESRLVRWSRNGWLQGLLFLLFVPLMFTLFNAAFPVTPLPVAKTLALGLVLPSGLAFTALRISLRLGPGLPRRYLLYLALTTVSTAALLTGADQRDSVFGALLLALFLLAPVLVRVETRPAALNAKPMASVFCRLLFGILFFALGAWSYSGFGEHGRLSGLVGMSCLLWVALYAVARDPNPA